MSQFDLVCRSSAQLATESTAAIHHALGILWRMQLAFETNDRNLGPPPPSRCSSAMTGWQESRMSMGFTIIHQCKTAAILKIPYESFNMGFQLPPKIKLYISRMSGVRLLFSSRV